MKNLSLTMSRYFLKIFLRDRAAIFFTLFFPVVFMLVFGFISDGEPDPVTLGLAPEANPALAEQLQNSLGQNPLLELREGTESELRQQVLEGDIDLLLVVPEASTGTTSGVSNKLTVVVDAAQVRQLGLIMPVLEQALLQVERDVRGTDPMFSLQVEDVKARSQRYLDFLVPGLLAFTIMQICIAGSGFNIVEYRRKGILKRLFVTPIQPRHFIFGIVTARGVFCLVQLAILLAIAIGFLQVQVVGSYLLLLAIIIMGIATFLSLGFCLGSLAKTQQSVMAIGNLVVFPQMFLSGVFYPIDALPGLIQPVAQLLPLSFLVDTLRAVVTDGAALMEMLPSLAGMIAWLVIGQLLAIRLFVWKEVAA